MGRSNLGLQHCHLHPSWYPQVLDPLGIVRQGLGQHARQQGMENKFYDIMKWPTFLFLVSSNIFSLIVAHCNAIIFVGCTHSKEGLWKGREGGPMGRGSAHAARPPGSRSPQDQPSWAVWNCWAGQETCWGCKVQCPKLSFNIIIIMHLI